MTFAIQPDGSRRAARCIRGPSPNRLFTDCPDEARRAAPDTAAIVAHRAEAGEMPLTWHELSDAAQQRVAPGVGLTQHARVLMPSPPGRLASELVAAAADLARDDAAYLTGEIVAVLRANHPHR